MKPNPTRPARSVAEPGGATYSSMSKNVFARVSGWLMLAAICLMAGATASAPTIT